MLRLLGSTIVAAAFLVAPAAAETNWSAYGNFSSVRCEDAKTIADIKESAKGLKFNEGGGRVFVSVSNVKIISSTTVRATANMLVCQLRVRIVEGGGVRTFSGRHTVQIYDNGRWRTSFQPNS